MIKLLRKDITSHYNTDKSIESYSTVNLIQINDVTYLNLQYRVYGDFGIKLLDEYSKDEMFLIKDIENLTSLLENLSNHIADAESIKESFLEHINQG